MPTHNIHTHWQVAQSSRTSQNLPKSMAAQPHGRKESTGIQQLSIRRGDSPALKALLTDPSTMCSGEP